MPLNKETKPNQTFIFMVGWHLIKINPSIKSIISDMITEL